MANSNDPVTILVVDDDLDNRTIARETLEAGGFRICEAADGLEALEIAAREKPSLVFLDLSMPKMDGWQAVGRMKADPQMRGIPVIAFTAHAMTQDRKKALDAGCDDVLTKPCTPQSLLEKTAEWIKINEGGKT